MPAFGLFCVFFSLLVLRDARHARLEAKRLAQKALNRAAKVEAQLASVKESALQAYDAAFKARVDVGALMKSTHQIQFVPAEPSADEKALNEAMRTNDMEALQRLSDVGVLDGDDETPLM